MRRKDWLEDSALQMRLADTLVEDHPHAFP